jgi:flagellar biosynthesis/type III secretory pathway protein FliH
MADEKPIDSERRSLSPESRPSKFDIKPPDNSDQKSKKRPPSTPAISEGNQGPDEYKKGFEKGYKAGYADGRSGTEAKF